MANRNFTQFVEQSPLDITDYLVGFKADESEEIKTQLKDVQDIVVGDSLGRLSAIEEAFDVVSPAQYIAPNAVLTIDPQFPSVVEVGTTFNIAEIKVDFQRNDAGPATQFQILRNNIIQRAESDSFSIDNVVEITLPGTTTYTGRVIHEATQDPDQIKTNILGLPSRTNLIPAGTVQTSRSYTGRYKIYYGSVATLPPNLRNLPPAVPVYDNLNTIVTTTINQLIIVIAIPFFKNLQRVITQANENITANFNLFSVNINDAGNNPVSYKLYTATTTTPLNLPITINLS